MKRIAKQICDESQEKALLLQEERAMRPGRGSEYLWYMSAAVSLIGTQDKPSQSEAFKRKAVDRVAKLLYKVLSLYDDPTEESLATEVSCTLDTSKWPHANGTRSSSRARPMELYLLVWLCKHPLSLLQRTLMPMSDYNLILFILATLRSI
jgi:hypothetical protein